MTETNYGIRLLDSRESKRVSFTLEAVLKAIEKNGVPQITGEFWDMGDDNIIVGACAMGMAAINLRVEWDALSVALESIRIGDHEEECDLLDDGWCDCGETQSLSDYIVNLNDSQGMTFKAIADDIREKLTPKQRRKSISFKSTVQRFRAVKTDPNMPEVYA